MAAGPARLGAVVAVDLHIIIGHVAAPAGAGGLALAHGDVDLNVVLGEDLLGEIFIEVHAPALAAHQNVAGGGGKVDVHLVRVEVGAGIAHGAQHTAPVGVGAEDGALGEVTNIIQRMRELSVQAANGTYSYDDRKVLQDEIDELQIEVDRISRDTEYNTKTLLDGSSDVRVYGENGTRYYVSDSVPAQMYNVNVVEMGGPAKVEVDFKEPTKDGVMDINGVSVNIVAGMDKEEYLREIRNAAEQAGGNVSVSEDGSKLIICSDFFGYDESIDVTMTPEIAKDLGATTYNSDCEYVISETKLTFGSVPTTDGTIRIDGTEVVVSATMTQEEYYDALTKAAVDNGYNAAKNAAGELEIRSESTDEAEFIQFAFSVDLSEELHITENYSGDYQILTAGKDAVVEVPEDVAGAGFSNTTTIETEGNRVIVTDKNGFSIDFLLKESFTPAKDADAVEEAKKNGNFQIEVTDIGSMMIQIGANEHQTMDIRISEVSASSLYIDEVDIAVVNGADRAMGTLDDALAKVSAIRSKLGAFQNRLDYAVSSLSTTSENMTAAYSGILDTDMAEEMTEYTQQNILNQAAVSVLSQANELPQQVLSLLQ